VPHLSRGEGWFSRHRYEVLKVFVWLDDLLVGLRLMPGLLALIIARKATEGEAG
jgi:hypothetical protein